ncbi:S8 family serine peptidase [Gallaecimonas sp. GXIMD4217]|uniref:S8 family serine peptidase n=1 Tax=Gallaecimonas sp. GXIMD4217 TaxID=3131927 RepID=UPI00311B2E7E
MHKKSIIALAVAAGFAGSALAEQGSKSFGWQRKVNNVINADVEVAANADGRNRYIVQFLQKPAALQAVELLQQPKDGADLGLQRAKAMPPTQMVRAALKTPAMKAYRHELARHKTVFMDGARQALGRELHSRLDFSVAFNGMVLDLSPAEAEQLLALPQVARVIKEVPHKLMTDNGPGHIGAGNVWDGSATGLSAKGEGVIVGIFDTGVNTDNRAFAATGDDGYTVSNPYGAGNFLGDCVSDASLCNDKLIGVYSYPEITGNYDGIRPANGEDYNGHGSHTASTTAGNVLHDVPVLLPGFREAVSDGVETGIMLPEMAGVAPHANVISYQVCDAQACYPSLTVKSVELAIEDGVDVINYSIGPSALIQPDPWNDPSSVAFLSAREAGIVVAMAAGNSGPGPSTDGNVAPWGLSVGATTHERIWTHQLSGTGAQGEVLAPITGVADVFTSFTQLNNLTESAPIVYAGDYEDMDGNNLALCDQRLSFRDPVNSELSGKVVICDRGEIPLVDKVSNMSRAAAVVIRNTASSNQQLVSVRYRLPTVLIDQQGGETLLDWVRTTDTPMVTLAGTEAQYDPAGADVMAPFSGRGPYAAVPELMVPHISAPGVDIYAAYADEMPFVSSFAAAPADFSFLSGTSMATPHVAGAAALLRQLHPDWTPAEIQSAMMLTANPDVIKEDGISPAGFFDTGSGVLRVDMAAQAGLVMDVPVDDYKAADPNQGGDPTLLNLPMLSDGQCPGTCSWTRTFRATRDGSWSLQPMGALDGVSLGASPAQFDIQAGESVQVTFTASLASRVGEDWSFQRFNLVPMDGSPTLSMPVALKPMIADIPLLLRQDYFWSQGVLTLPGLRFRYPSDVVLNAKPLERATTHELLVAQDSDNSSPFDDLADGASVQMLDVATATDLRVIVGASEAKDVDLFIGLDSNNNGLPEVVELTQVCATVANVGEGCSFNAGEGLYWVLVHNFEGSGADQDRIRLDVLMSPSEERLDTVASLDNPSADPYQFVDASLDWIGEMDQGVYYGELEIFDRTSSSTNRVLGSTSMVINRTAPTTTAKVVQGELAHGQRARVELLVPGNPTPDELEYRVELDMDAGLALVESSGVEGMSVSHSDTELSIRLPAGAKSGLVQFDLAQRVPASGDFQVTWSLDSDKAGFQAQGGSFALGNSNQAPTLSFPASLSADMGTSLELDLGLADADGDALDYSVRQTAGPAVEVQDKGNGLLVLDLPEVDGDRRATFEVSVSDGEFTESRQFTLVIKPLSEQGGSGGGSLGLGLGLLALMGLRRRR